VGHRKRLPVIAIDNQHAITNTQVLLPRGYRRTLPRQAVTRLMTPRRGRLHRTVVFPGRGAEAQYIRASSDLAPGIRSTTPRAGDYALVYVTSPAKDLAKLLQQIRFHFHCLRFKNEGQDGNILFKKPSMGGFLQDLAGCKASSRTPDFPW